MRNYEPWEVCHKPRFQAIPFGGSTSSERIIKKLVQTHPWNSPVTGYPELWVDADELSEKLAEWEETRTDKWKGKRKNRFEFLECPDCGIDVEGDASIQNSHCSNCRIDIRPVTVVYWMTPKAAEVAEVKRHILSNWLLNEFCPYLGRAIKTRPFPVRDHLLCDERDLLMIKTEYKAGRRRTRNHRPCDADWGIVTRYADGNYRATLARLAEDTRDQLADVKRPYRVLHDAATKGTPPKLSTKEQNGFPGRRCKTQLTATRSDVDRFLLARSTEQTQRERLVSTWLNTPKLQPRVKHRLSELWPHASQRTKYIKLAEWLKRAREFGELVEERDWSADRRGRKAYYYYNPETVVPWLKSETAIATAPTPESSTAMTEVSAAKRPCWDRDHLWLNWYEADGEDTFHSYAAIRAKWNELPQSVRDEVCPHNPNHLAAGRPGTDIVKAAVRTATKERSR